jgi:hypothetical protein
MDVWHNTSQDRIDQGVPSLWISAIETILSDTIIEITREEDQMAVMPPQEFSLPLLVFIADGRKRRLAN